MYPFTVADLQIALGGAMLCGRAKRNITGPEIEFVTERTLVTSSYIERLVKRKKSCLLVPATFEYDARIWSQTQVCIIQVPDLLKAARATAAYIRSNLEIPVVQVSGSAGKTTTKDMLGAILRRTRPLVSRGNQNSTNGVCHNLRRATPRHRVAVLEAGMNGPGQLRRISAILRPDILVITSIQREHLLRLGSLENIIAAKAEALEHLSPRGLLVINGEDPNCAQFPVHRFSGKVMRFGFSNKFDVWATDIKQTGFQTSFMAHGKGFSVRCQIATFGKYNVSNALAAICVGHHLGVSPKAMASGLKRFRPAKGRLKIQQGKAGRVIIDDWYNANPESTCLLLQALSPWARRRNLLLILGDQERPDADPAFAEQVHYDLGGHVAKLKPSRLLAVGKWAEHYVRGAVEAGYPVRRAIWCPTMSQAEQRLAKLLQPDQLVVFKASRWINPDEKIFSNASLKVLV